MIVEIEDGLGSKVGVKVEGGESEVSGIASSMSCVFSSIVRPKFSSMIGKGREGSFLEREYGFIEMHIS